MVRSDVRNEGLFYQLPIEGLVMPTNMCYSVRGPGVWGSIYVYKLKAYYGTNNLYICVILLFLLLMRLCVLGVVSLAIPKVFFLNIAY